jgi:hypothetical protein
MFKICPKESSDNKVSVGLAISRITKHRIVSKGGPTGLRGEPAYKHEFCIL